jgi:hypothetical protein
MKHLVFLLLMPMLFNACIGTTIITGKGEIVNEQINLADFHSIELRGAADVEVSKGNDVEIILSDYENLLQYHRISVENGKLIIEKNDPFVQMINSKAKVRIVLPQSLNNIALSGSGDIHLLTQFSAINKISISGSGRIYAINNNNIFDNIATIISGSGSIEIKGTCSQLDATISGSGKLYLSDLQAKNVDCKITGSGSAYVNAEKQLNAIISGSGNIEYSGNANVNTQITGSGRVIQR